MYIHYKNDHKSLIFRVSNHNVFNLYDTTIINNWFCMFWYMFETFWTLLLIVFVACTVDQDSRNNRHEFALGELSSAAPCYWSKHITNSPWWAKPADFLYSSLQTLSSCSINIRWLFVCVSHTIFLFRRPILIICTYKIITNVVLSWHHIWTQHLHKHQLLHSELHNNNTWSRTRVIQMWHDMCICYAWTGLIVIICTICLFTYCDT